MRHTRRLIAIVIGCATYSVAAVVAAATVAYARVDPGGGVTVYPPVNRTADAVATPMWKFIAVAALGALLAIAIVGLIASLRHRHADEPSRMLHA